MLHVFRVMRQVIKEFPNVMSSGRGGAKYSRIFDLSLGPGLEIFPSLRVYMKETVRRVTPRTTLRSVLRQQATLEGGGSLEFFQGPGPL